VGERPREVTEHKTWEGNILPGGHPGWCDKWKGISDVLREKRVARYDLLQR